MIFLSSKNYKPLFLGSSQIHSRTERESALAARRHNLVTRAERELETETQLARFLANRSPNIYFGKIFYHLSATAREIMYLQMFRRNTTRASRCYCPR